MYNRAWCWHFQWTAFYWWKIFGVWHWTLSANFWWHQTTYMATICFLENIYQDPLEYGYRLTEGSKLVPIISTKSSIPSNFPQPCNCQKYGKVTVCKCWLLEYRYCLSCKCDASPRCRIPVTLDVKTQLNWTAVCYVYIFCRIYFDCSKVSGTSLILNIFNG